MDTQYVFFLLYLLKLKQIFKYTCLIKENSITYYLFDVICTVYDALKKDHRQSIASFGTFSLATSPFFLS